MKKIISLLLAVIFILPIVVKADEVYVDTFYNRNVIVNGEVELHTLIDYLPDDCIIEYSYDPTMLSITPEMVSFDGVSETNRAKVEAGKVTVNVANIIEGIESYGNSSVTLRFKALKEGEAKIVITFATQKGYIKSNVVPLINITKSVESNTTVESTEQPQNTQVDNKEEVTKTEEKTTGEITNFEKTTNENKDNKNNDVFLYCSIGLNVLLLIGLIILILKKESPKAIEVQSEPIPTNNNE